MILLACAVAGVAIFDAALGFVIRWFSARIGEGLIYDLRTQVFDHVQRQPIAFFTRAQTGSLVSRLDGDVVGAQQAITSTLSGVLSNLLSLVVILIALFYLSWQVTVIALVMIPLFILPGPAGRPPHAAADQGEHAAQRRDGLDDDRAVQRRGRDAGEAVRAAPRGVRRVRRHARPRSATSAWSPPCTARCSSIALTLLASMVTAVVYGLGGTLVIRGTFQIGTLVALTTLLARVYGPITSLSSVQVNVMTALVSFDRVFEVLDLKPLVAEKPGAVALPRAETRAGPARPRPGDRVRRRVVPLSDGERGVARLAGVDRAAGAGAEGRRPPGCCTR